MKVIAFLNQKGGVGKTTLATNVAGAIARRSRRLLFVDSDPQGSALDWSQARQVPSLFQVVGLPRPVLHKELPDLGNGYDYVVIDGPPRQDALAKSAIAASDIVVVPVQPSPYDIWAAQETIELIREASVFKEAQKIVFAINRKIANTAIGRDVEQALSQFEGVRILATPIHQRVIFAESVGRGLTVGEIDAASAAAEEIEALTTELLSL